MSDSEYRKELRRLHKEQGLCCFCDSPVQLDRSMCIVHLDKQRDKANNRKILRTLNGKCRYCKDGEALLNKSKCQKCADRAKEEYKNKSIDYKNRARSNYQSRYLASKAKVYTAYGNKCQCCNENQESFLTLDHVNSDGNLHRAALKSKGGETMIRWIVENNFPDTIQLLCANCHLSKTRLGECVHKVPISGS